MNVQPILAKIRSYPLAVGLMVAAVVMAGLAYWMEAALEEAKAQNETVENDLKIVQRNITYGNADLTAQLAQLNQDREKLNAALIDPIRILENQQYFFGFESTSNVTIIDPTQILTEKAKDSDLSVSTYTVAASGSWENMATLLYDLQTGPHLLRFSQFQLEKTAQAKAVGGDPKRLTLTFTAQILGK